MKQHARLIILGLAISAPTLAMAEQEQAKSMTVPAAQIEAVTAASNVAATQQGKKTVLISPRTGIRYAFDNPNNRPITFKTEVLLPANSQTVSRIVASNPALSVESQQQAEQTLLNIGKPANPMQ
ncbi:hypothetical protein F4V57_06180 [Acinetobacter qingfengensis]|uniref:Uncharacterized protein n=1 Tax=Acinetobacter qingfengensis TaxID=1262585 RepID=A0A1E7RAL8_9GAMM|nr:hypothetical protein [Acinetobacter qingfengensis]KAA8734538.1 hypothetical protein F4V57_06180 [Acinetobacter qingfengensis]OEY96410.1 hypothetical protein BJI46_12260 [Acinetobacter qingfengensis]